MKIKCPNCGNKGPTDFFSAGFEVRGVWQGMPVRKCRRCGADLLLPPFRKPQLIESELWSRMEETWEEEFGPNARDELVERMDEVLSPPPAASQPIPLVGLGLLGADEFAGGEDAYLQTAYRFLADEERQPPVPELVVSTGTGMLVHLLPQLGLRKELERWVFNLQRVIAIAYMLVVAETWNELDRDRAKRLIEEGLAEASRQMEERQGAPLNYDDWDERISTTVYGLPGSEVYGAARSYLFAQPAYERLATLERLAGEPFMVEAKVKRKELATYERCARVAWSFGIGLGLLDLLGEVPRPASPGDESARL
jgi:hypothetical protein